MNWIHSIRKALLALSLVFVLFTTSACGGVLTGDRVSAQPPIAGLPSSSQIQRGDTGTGQNFGDWVIKTAHGLVQDAYVRDNDKLGVVISPQVQPTEVKPLAKSLVQGFQKNFPNRDLKVLIYAPDKKLILTANYNDKTRKVEYQ